MTTLNAIQSRIAALQSSLRRACTRRSAPAHLGLRTATLSTKHPDVDRFPVTERECVECLEPFRSTLDVDVCVTCAVELATPARMSR